MRKHLIRLCCVLTCMMLLFGCAKKTKYLISPKSFEFESTAKIQHGSLYYKQMIDSRDEKEREGSTKSSCLGGEKYSDVLGDADYAYALATEIDIYIKNGLSESDLFTQINDAPTPGSEFTFESTLNRFHVYVNESEARTAKEMGTFFCGGLVGGAMAKQKDVETTTDISITGVLFKGETEVWRQTVTHNVVTVEKFPDRKINVENSMGIAIGECCTKLINDLAMFLEGD
jgi:hypothetical protein